MSPGFLAFGIVTGLAAAGGEALARRASRLARFLLAVRSDAPMDGRVWVTGKVAGVTVARLGLGETVFEPRARFGFSPARVKLEGGPEVELASAWCGLGSSAEREALEKAGWRWFSPGEKRPEGLPLAAPPAAVVLVRSLTDLQACAFREGDRLVGRPGAPVVILPAGADRAQGGQELAELANARRFGWRGLAVVAGIAAAVAFWLALP